jgi:Ca2+-binding EF-hand superfamily protein
MEIDTD